MIRIVPIGYKVFFLLWYPVINNKCYGFICLVKIPTYLAIDQSQCSCLGTLLIWLRIVFVPIGLQKILIVLNTSTSTMVFFFSLI